MTSMVYGWLTVLTVLHTRPKDGGGLASSAPSITRAAGHKFSRPCENSMRGSVRSRREPSFAIFSALRGYRPRNLGTAQQIAEFSHGLSDICRESWEERES